ncbi:SCO7613 C-terminal domain-containing membrane protein [Streptomyces sp. NPDC059076]|uniref:SCO7613 C-terminal domain-containing membrane protein n=1 Tax=unclassified Streptomyces TaxID=2593676 RepID=UPI0036B6FB88
MKNAPPTLPPAEEIAVIDRELVQLDHRRSQLLARRAYLVSVLHRPAAPHARAGVRAATARPVTPRPEASPPGVQNVLLTLGGVLLAIAAIAFTVVSWGDMGIGGRSAVLAVVTAAALLTPAILLRRGLGSTAEALAVLALVLLVLDAYAVFAVALSGVSGLTYSTWAAALLAALWAAYGAALPKLHTPLPAAVVAAQLPLLLWSVNGAAADAAPAPSLAWALLGTAALDVALVMRVTRSAVRVTATVGAVFNGALVLMLGGFESLAAESALDAVEPAVLLTLAGAVALIPAWRFRVVALPCAVVAGLALIAAFGGVIAATAPSGWAMPGYLVCAIALLLVVQVPALAARPPADVLRGLGAASAALMALALVSTLPLVVLQYAGPLTVLPNTWAGAPTDARAALGEDLTDGNWAATALVLVLLAGVLLAVSRRLPDQIGTGPQQEGEGATAGPEGAGTARTLPPVDLRAWAGVAAAVLAWAALTMAPYVLDTGYPQLVGWQSALGIALLALSLDRVRYARGLRFAAEIGMACALVGAASTTALALATRAATFTVLGTFLTAFTAVAALSRAGRIVRAVAGCAAVVWGSGLVVALAEAWELAPHRTAVVLMAVPAVVALLAARLRTHPIAAPLECTAALVGVVALALATDHAPTVALVLALGGVIAAGTAIRTERRTAAGWSAAVLFLLATWVRLAASEVTVPEAYTLPVTVPALVVGVLRRRSTPDTSSWTAYGAGLSVTMVPSLVAVWGEGDWLRPLLLGTAALAVTLAGARQRLQAPLVLGGAVLALVTLHELAPYVVQAVDALPRWLPPALAGLLLLVVGATYEQRLREARRLRETLGRMR